MRLDKKIYLTIKNNLQAWLYSYRINKLRDQGYDVQNAGALDHVEKATDFIYKIGMAFGKKASFETFSLDTGIRFNQSPWNFCIYASRAQGRSMQDGIRWSARWLVKNARRMGFITGDGWSHLRGGNEVAYKVGYLPYELMPDETFGMSWEDYSKWTAEDEKLLEVAAKYKSPGYFKVTTKSDAIEAMENGHILFTAGKWYSGMNDPEPPNFLLRAQGEYIGGHAYGYAEYRLRALNWKAPQTFSANYGDKGAAWVENILGPNQFAIYIESHMPATVRAGYFIGRYEGKAVKGTDSAIYILEQGLKRPFTSWEGYVAWCATQQIDPNSFAKLRDDVIDAIPTGNNM